MIDNTAFFKARVKMLLKKEADKTLIKNEQNKYASKTSKNSENFCLFSQHAREIVQNITEFRNLVLDKRKEYILCSGNISNNGNFTYMSEVDRKRFDKADYLRKICRLANLVEMYETNMEQAKQDEEAQARRLARLHMDIEEKRYRELSPKKVPKRTRIDDYESDEAKNEEKLQRKKSSALYQDALTYEDVKPEPELELSKNEQSQLLIENKQLIEKLSHTNAEILHIESQMAEIQKLQTTFASKILEQEQDIDTIHTHAIHTIDNLEVANEFIREAIRNSATRRVVALFCLIVLTFTLLFLDWYNP